MNDLKPGDKVICIEPKHNLIKNGMYTIEFTYMANGDNYVRLVELPRLDGGFFARRFKLASQEIELW